MSRIRSLGTLGVCLFVVLEVLVFASGAWAQSTFKALYKFTGLQDGGQPVAGLIFDQTGNLYGTTLEGGVTNSCGRGCGVVFKLAPNADGTWTETVIATCGPSVQRNRTSFVTPAASQAP
jgi:hypothetical protein